VGTLKLQQGALTTIASSGGSTANSVRADAGAYDNTSLLCPIVDLVLGVTFGSAPTPGAGIVIGCYFVPYTDGTTLGTVDTSTPRFPSGTFAGNFEVITTGTSQVLVLQGIALDALKYEVYLDNQSGQTMSSGWTLKAQPTDWQY
jgi:hypothetical protein